MPHRKKSPLSAECQAEAVNKFMGFLGQFGPLPTEVREFLLPHLRLEVYEKKWFFGREAYGVSTFILWSAALCAAPTCGPMAKK
ncbi:hypothetical protein [Runella slithyformis]|uniref:Uncharacterized protein n=1 Tax=Runella slithyformis (strain ATCC 29530 / DSM 19594 / LMG 11500 / NCIMB 11436 / LSU 4) TaxID=761193 RepID=A0A7U4E7Q4_RUNSL|nr:hypothetical protein [Runella slithyformis]AEI50563.1 hypothetical protein Runsl_4219 [Runella slithyformis DSM 19594]